MALNRSRFRDFSWEEAPAQSEKPDEAIIAFHGSGVRIETFRYDHVGKGVDELGSGFYFTSSFEDAAFYSSWAVERASQREGVADDPSVHEVELSIRNPLDADAVGDISVVDVRAIIERAPELDEQLMNWGDVGGKGRESVIRKAVDVYAGHDLPILKVLFALANDFFPDDVPAFNLVIRDVLGYDGIRRELQNGDVHWVAWFPDQIRIRRIVAALRHEDEPRAVKSRVRSSDIRGLVQ